MLYWIAAYCLGAGITLGMIVRLFRGNMNGLSFPRSITGSLIWPVTVVLVISLVIAELVSSSGRERR